VEFKEPFVKGGGGAQRWGDFRGKTGRHLLNKVPLPLFTVPFPPSRRPVQGLVGEPIGFVILFARHMLNRERFQAGDHLLRPLLQGLQSRTLHLVDALDLARQ
jgi:hypothetical protein